MTLVLPLNINKSVGFLCAYHTTYFESMIRSSSLGLLSTRSHIPVGVPHTKDQLQKLWATALNGWANPSYSTAAVCCGFVVPAARAHMPQISAADSRCFLLPAGTPKCQVSLLFWFRGWLRALPFMDIALSCWWCSYHEASSWTTMVGHYHASPLLIVY